MLTRGQCEDRPLGMTSKGDVNTSDPVESVSSTARSWPTDCPISMNAITIDRVGGDAPAATLVDQVNEWPLRPLNVSMAISPGGERPGRMLETTSVYMRASMQRTWTLPLCKDQISGVSWKRVVDRSTDIP